MEIELHHKAPRIISLVVTLLIIGLFLLALRMNTDNRSQASIPAFQKCKADCAKSAKQGKSEKKCIKMCEATIKNKAALEELRNPKPTILITKTPTPQVVTTTTAPSTPTKTPTKAPTKKPTSTPNPAFQDPPGSN